MSESSKSRRMTLTIGPVVALLVALFLGHLAWIEWQQDRLFDEEGVTVTGTISRFQYWDGGHTRSAGNRAGYYAVVTYPTPLGPRSFRTGQRFDAEADRKSFLGLPLGVRYLRADPERARVLQWHRSGLKEMLPMWAALAAGVVALVFVWKTGPRR